ncbi:MAG: sodium-dependent transporter [Betaproteobacteria bacterium]|nr:sodium-dependent transporter [Betaproteobacteria bacterium]MCL2162283.1 sodium-dependent transporter [Betaproteobacteria bacterium]
MSQSTSSRSTWSNRWAFILVTIGSAVGLGNIWKFSYIAGASEGSVGIFVVVYLACVALIGLPLLMAEILIGRRGRGNPVVAMLNTARESGNSPWWALLGWVGIFGALMILSFYSVVSGWMVDYFWHSLVEGVQVGTPEAAVAAYDELMSNPLRLSFWHTIFMILATGVVARGVIGGIETANKIMLPLLFLILVLLTLWGAAVGDMPTALRFMFNLKVEAIKPGVVLDGMGHAFFSLSLGMGAIMAYGSYLDKRTSIGNTCVWIVVAGVFIGLLCGAAIFSLTFGFDLTPDTGPGLMLKTLPLAFTHMPGGRVFATLFFLFVIFAAWTSAISLLEPFVSWLTERYGIRRARAAWATALPVWLLGVAVCLSFNDWSEYRIFDRNLFGVLDHLATRFIMPLSGLAIAIYVGWRLGKVIVVDEIRLKQRAFTLWFNVLRYVVPVGISLVFLYELGGTALLIYVVPAGILLVFFIIKQVLRDWLK